MTVARLPANPEGRHDRQGSLQALSSGPQAFEASAAMPVSRRPTRTGGADSRGAGDEDALLQGLRSGDDRSYEAIIRNYGGHLLNVARRLLQDDHEAQNAVRTAFLAAFRAIHENRDPTGLSILLHRMVVSAALSKIGARVARGEETIDDLLPVFTSDGTHATAVPMCEERADNLVERRGKRAMVRACIDRLPESYRVVLQLHDIEQFDVAETARLLQLSSHIVKVRLHRARLALTTLLMQNSD